MIGVIELGPSLHPPGHSYWLGTDLLGRSAAQLLLEGTLRTIADVSSAALVAGGIGLVIGTLASLYRRQWLRVFLEAAVTVAYGAPLLVVLLLLLGLLGDRPGVFPFVAGFFSWPGIALATDSAMRRELSREYVHASRALGAGSWWVWRRHILPNARPAVFAAIIGTLPQLIQLSILLAFLGVGGLGASLGGLIREGFEMFPAAWWLWLPSTVIAILLTATTTILVRRLADG